MKESKNTLGNLELRLEKKEELTDVRQQRSEVGRRSRPSLWEGDDRELCEN